MLSLFAAEAPLPAPLTAYDPTIALPDFGVRVEKLRRWQQGIASGYVTTQKEEALQAEFLNLVFGQALGYEHERPDYRQLLLERKTNVDGTKPDGALGQFAADPKGRLGGPVRAVVELKDARTGLDAKQKLGAKGRAETPVEQAFSYPSKMLPCTHKCVGRINFGPMAQFGDLRLEKKVRFCGPRFSTGTAWWCGNWPRTGPRR